MRKAKKERKAIGTARRKKARDLLAVLFFLLMLPYTCSVLFGLRQEDLVQTSAGAVQDEKQGGYVLWKGKNGVLRMPVEEFLVGALAACIPAGYQPETLKAQAVILRSACRAQGAPKEQIQGEESGIAFLDETERQKYWGDEAAEREETFRKAVEETRGIVLAWEGEAVSPPFFRVSAGKTRDGGEIFGGQQMAWCRSVECPHDVEEEGFLQETHYGREEFVQRLSSEGFVLPQQGARIVLTRDGADYVISVGCGDCYIEGEKFRKLFALPSSCFYLREEEGKIVLQTKGVGHGLGFDQYAADLLAKEGLDYIELLDHFFEGLSLEKME